MGNSTEVGKKIQRAKIPLSVVTGVVFRYHTK